MPALHGAALHWTVKMTAPQAQPIGKGALAVALGWTRPKLDRRLNSDPSFPVVRKGDQSGGWAFHLPAVKTYLAGKNAPAVSNADQPSGPAIDLAQLRDAVLPPPSVAHTLRAPRKSAVHGGEATARQRKDAADAALRENKLKVENRELVDRGKMRQVLADVFTSLGNDLDALSDEIARLLQLPDEAPRIRDLIDKARSRMVSNAAPILTDE